MSQFKLAKLIKRNKPSESASRSRPNWNVGDSVPIRSHCITNATSTFSGFIVLTAVSMLALPLVLSSTDAYAADSLTVEISNSGLVDMSVASTNANGTFVKSNNQTVSVKTSNATGYTLKIAASDATNYNKLINSEDSDTSTNALISVTEATTEEQFKSLANTSYNGKWGYLPSKYCTGSGNGSCSSNTDFLPAPTATGDTLDETTTANPTTANTYNLAIGARVDGTQKLGSYSNTYVVYASANAISYSIVYDDNVVSNMPTDVNDGQAVGGQFNLANNTPTRAGYKFLGWCTVQPTNNNGTDTCTGGTTYQPNAGITISSATNFHLYAMWKKASTMQTWSECSALSVGDTITLEDERDGESYLIGKLADNKCWMLDNLRLGGTSAINLTPADTNITSNFTLPASISSGFNSYTESQINASYKDQTVTSYGAGSGKIGVYYNYCAASGGTYCMAQGSGTDDAEHDICPAGWRMPTGGSSGEYMALTNAYGLTYDEDYEGYLDDGSSTGLKYNLSTPLSGYFDGSSAGGQGSGGGFWSSTRRSGYSMYDLGVGSDGVGPEVDYGRYYGYSVRCIAQ